jgi:hypothetical protein
MGTMFGWSRRPASSASWRKRRTCSSEANCPARIIFNATTRLAPFWRARNTTPMPPRAISPSNSYSPKSLPGVGAAPHGPAGSCVAASEGGSEAVGGPAAT